MPLHTARRFIIEVFIALALLCALSYIFVEYDFFDRWYEYTRAHEDWELDEIGSVLIAVLLAGFYLAVRYAMLMPKPAGRTKKQTHHIIRAEKDDLTPSLTALYVLGLSIIAFLLVMSYVLAQNSIGRQAYDAKIINMSGRQRMLSQRMALLTAQLTYPDKREWARKGLRRAADEMKAAHMGLSRGDIESGLPGPQSETIGKMYFDKDLVYGAREQQRYLSLDDLVLHYLKEVEEVLALSEQDLNLDNPLIQHTINDYHDRILPLLDDIVSQYEAESMAGTYGLQKLELGILIAALAVLILNALFIFQPMVRRIQRRTAALIEANRELEQRRRKEKLSALGEMSGNLAHEINNALQPILGLSQAALKRIEGKDERLENYMKTIEDGALHAKKIVETVLEFSRTSSGLDFKEYQARQILGEAIAFARSLLPEEINVQISETQKLDDLTAGIFCNKTNLMQIFINIFKNAGEATEGPGVITVGFEQRLVSADEAQTLELLQGQYVVIKISDQGEGMDQETLESIFTPFFTTKEESEGTGLGLSTVYGLMKQHQGAVTAQSTVGEGSDFILFFPVLRQSKSAEGE